MTPAPIVALGGPPTGGPPILRSFPMNLSLSSQVEPITDAIYDAGLGAATWTDVSRRLEQCLHSRVAIFAQSEKPVEALAMCSEADDRRAREYLEHYWTDDIAMRRIRTSGSYEIIRDSDLMAEGARPRSAFYDEFLGEDAFWGVYAPVLRLERSNDRERAAPAQLRRLHP